MRSLLSPRLAGLNKIQDSFAELLLSFSVGRGDSCCSSILYNPNALRIGRSCIEKRIASSSEERLACSCQDQSGTMKVSPFSQWNGSPLIMVVPLPRKA